MSRYIDAEKLLKVSFKNPIGLTAFQGIIKRQPTADVVPMEFHEKCMELEILKRENMVEVVRCKDCKYWQEYQEGHYPNELCPWDKNETTDEDDYCSYGERREDDKG